MSDLGYNNTTESAQGLGVILPSGYTTTSIFATHNFIITDSVGTGTADPVDWFRFTVPDGVSKIRISMDASSRRIDDEYSYSFGLIGPVATKISGESYGYERTGSFESKPSFGFVYSPLGFDSVWQVDKGEYFVQAGVSAGTIAGNLEYNYTIRIDLVEHLSVQPGVSGNGGTTDGGHGSIGGGNSGSVVTGASIASSSLIMTVGDGSYMYGQGLNDHVIYQEPRSDFSIEKIGGNDLKISHKPGVYSSLSLDGVEFIEFANKETVCVLTPERAKVALLYSAALDRTPDVPGLMYWQSNYDNHISPSLKHNDYQSLAMATIPENGLSIAGGFTNSSEFLGRYGSLDDVGFVTQLYNNVLDRAPDSAGIDSWLQLMHQGDQYGTKYTREMILVGFAESPENYKNALADWLVIA